MSGVKKKLSGSQKRKIREEKEYNNSKYAKLDNFLISASSSSCACASSSNPRELEQGQAHPGIHKRRIWPSSIPEVPLTDVTVPDVSQSSAKVNDSETRSLLVPERPLPRCSERIKQLPKRLDL
ncbi:hypothetical protein TNCV_5098271 [Trichonephila clavipes]|uniref:Uncharacterized protein n=1 Tax=Trichonephila clavipes TaxID=2585209 RepID=A0A8X6RXG5_TRICX|nr:hypothetical protein TNCV_5098271 [Trichonephila clavipes]